MLTASARAQYFQAKYVQDPNLGGTGINGMTTKYTGAGHLIGGLSTYQDNNPCPYLMTHWGLFVTRTDDAGGFSLPSTFNNTYLFQDAGGNEIRLSGGQVLEYRDGSGYGAIFSYYLYIPPPISCGQPFLTQQGVAFVRFDASGAVLTVSGFPMPSTGYHTYVNDIRESKWQSGDIYATGEWNSAGFSQGNSFWALRVRQNGTLVWGNVYSNNYEMAYGIMDTPSGDNEAVIVGSIGDELSGSMDAFFMKINSTTGAPLSVNEIDAGNFEYFLSINRSDEPGNPGYILGGYNDGQAWLTKTDYSGNIQWMQQYNPVGNNPSTNPLSAHDVKGRFNSVGRYEYYATGPYTNGCCAGDAFIFRTDQSGIPMNPNAFSFYDTGSEETTNRIDVNTSGVNDGVSAYGVVETGTQREGYIVKAYFNEVTACGQKPSDLDNHYNQWVVSPYSFNTTPLGSQNLSLFAVNPNSDKMLCNAPFIPNGDNSRTAMPTGIKTLDKENSGFNLFPNPCNTAVKPVTATISSNGASLAKVTVVNLLGQIVYTKEHQLQPGSNTLQLDFTGAPLNNGMYEINIQTSEGVQTSRFISDNAK